MVDGKQVKVDNWGIFFLQRLQQFYNKTFFCDLTLQFEDNVQVKVHRLVMNACTEYFQMLEHTCEVDKDCLMMPSNLPSDVVIPIINFMYSGILEFQESLFDRLYSTAKLMNMSVLTKLLDAQKTPIKPITPMPKRVQSVTPITWNLQGKKIMTKNFMEPELPETLPGRKLPIWKRKSAPSSLPYAAPNSSSRFDEYTKPFKSNLEEAPKPTRFEWPEEDDSNFENSFDEISYTSKPLILPSLRDKSPKPSTSSTFEEIKKTAMPVKRSASPIGNPCKKVNIQDVKEYLKEHKIRSDFIDYDDSEITDNDLQTYDNDDSNEEGSKDASDIFTQHVEESPSKSILKTDSSTSSSNKHVRFSLEGKENTSLKLQSTPAKIQPKTSKADPNIDMSKHTKIITEVLKKYPHLVKNNKNIRLKILAKGNNATSTKGFDKYSSSRTQVATAKPASKVSYMVMKPDSQKSVSQTSDKDKNSEVGSWECTRCEEPKQFKTYHTYRQHLTEAHNEKQDSQMCILCGHICRKQNMLVYHKFIKHNIPPPAMYNFPKCKECNYIALSQALLVKHQLNHTSTINPTCSECGLTCSNKQTLVTHLQQTGHTHRVVPNFSCNFCDKRFFSENILNAHIKRSHENDLKQEANEIKQEIKKEEDDSFGKSKEKIKILSDIKVNTSVPSGTIVPVRTINEIRTIKTENTVAVAPEPLEPSSEAEALSNVASGIAASLGLVDTIVVLDENQFILQSAPHANIQENILNSAGQDYILPEMQMSDLTSIATTNIEQVTQHPTVTLSSDTNTVLTQSPNKSGITSTDELVMVLTDHDYSDAANNAVITDNNIVVLYSHPVQTQATMMITSETGMIEVGKNYAVTSEIPGPDEVVTCEESIEMIQQEINNQLEEAQVTEQTVEMQQYVHQTVVHHIEPMVEGKMQINTTQGNEYRICEAVPENVTMILQDDRQSDIIPEAEKIEIENAHNQQIEESIEMIQDEINKMPHEVIEVSHSVGNEATDISTEKSETEVITFNNAEDPCKSENEIVETNTELQFVDNQQMETAEMPESIAQDHCEASEEIVQDTVSASEELETAGNQNKTPFNESENSEIVSEEMETLVLEPEETNHLENAKIVADPNKFPSVENPNEYTAVENPNEYNTPIETQNNLIEISEVPTTQEEIEVTEELDQVREIVHNMVEAVHEQHNLEMKMDMNLSSVESTSCNEESSETCPSSIESCAMEIEQENINDKENVEETNVAMEVEQISPAEGNEENTRDADTCNVASTSQEIEALPNISNVEQTDDKPEEMSTDQDENISTNEVYSEQKTTTENNNHCEQKRILNAAIQNEKISQLLDDWDDGDTDSQQSFSKSVPSTPPPSNGGGDSINKLINDWEDEEDT